MNNMFNSNDIIRDDVVSIGKNGIAYITENDGYTGVFDGYRPEQKIIDQIGAWLAEKDELLDIQAFGASWCGDCRIQIPRLGKVVSLLPSNRILFSLHLNIKVDPPSQRKPGAPIWRSPPSPPETVDYRFDMYHIPAIYLFLKSGRCIGKIDERPKYSNTLEAEIFHYLTNYS